MFVHQGFSLTSGKYLTVFLSVILTVSLFAQLGYAGNASWQGWLWGVLYAMVGLALSMAYFALPSRLRDNYSQGRLGAFLSGLVLFVLLLAVSLAASIGSLSSSLSTAVAEKNRVSDERALLKRQIQQYQDQIAVLTKHEKINYGGGRELQDKVEQLRQKIAALPAAKNSNALSLVTTLSGIFGVAVNTIAAILYVTLSLLIDACAVFFILVSSNVYSNNFSNVSKNVTENVTGRKAGSNRGSNDLSNVFGHDSNISSNVLSNDSCGDSNVSETLLASNKMSRTGSNKKRKTLSVTFTEEQSQSHTASVESMKRHYAELLAGDCKLTIAAIRQFYGVGTQRAGSIMDTMQALGLVHKKDNGRYELTAGE